jgi:hypothetical protein
MAADFPSKQDIARHFIQCYLAARSGLTALGILRSERHLQADYAEWLVAEYLHLQLATSTIQSVYDALDDQGLTYQIKSRIVRHPSQSTSFDFATIDKPFDYLVCVFFSPELEVLAIIRVPYQVVSELASRTNTTTRFRWNRQTANDPRIERLAWPEQTSSLTLRVAPMTEQSRGDDNEAG